MTILGALAGIGITIAVYPHILQRRAKKLFALCSTSADRAGDPISNYWALLMYQTTQAYERLLESDIARSREEIESVIASYATWLTRNDTRSESEQSTLDAIMQACNRSETLQYTIDERKKDINNESVDQILKELEKELANQ